MPTTYNATRYIVPLREGGSLPAVLDTDRGGMFVAKFRGAGQGAKALIAEIIVAGLAEALGLPVPELALIELDESFGRSERDPEIQDVLKQSLGLNVGLRYLEGAFNFDPVAMPDVDPELAAEIVWLDSFVTNIDRTARNPNMMLWKDGLWLIDHGAALYFHHNWDAVNEQMMAGAFPAVRNHVLLPFAGDISAVDARLAGKLGAEAIRDIVEHVPEQLLLDAPVGVRPSFESAAEGHRAYTDYLVGRLGDGGARPFAVEAERARLARLTEQPTEQRYRR